MKTGMWLILLVIQMAMTVELTIMQVISTATLRKDKLKV